jgi:hypothetical protein
MEDEYQINEYQEENTKRPKFLLVLCIMTICNAGLTLVNGLFSLFSVKPSEVEIAKANSQISKSLDLLIDQELYYWVDVIKKVQIMTEAMYTNFMAYITVSIIVSLCGLLAAIFMLFLGQVFARPDQERCRIPRQGTAVPGVRDPYHCTRCGAPYVLNEK